MVDIDPYTAVMGGGMVVLTIIAGWSTAQFELNMTTQWRITRYVSSVLAVVLGFGFCQMMAGKIAVLRGFPADSMLVVLVGAIIGSFLVMWGAQAVEYATRRYHGLEPLPYRLARFDLFRW